MISFPFRASLAALALLCATASLPAQVTGAAPADPKPADAAGDPAKREEEKTLATIRALKASIAETEGVLKEKRVAMAAATGTEAEALGVEIQELNGKVTKLRDDLESVAAGIDLNAFAERPVEAVDLATEMRDFLKPLVRQLREMTSRPREIEELKNNVAYHTKRKETAQKALDQVETLLAAAGEDSVAQDLEEVKKAWEQRLEQAGNNLTIAEFQLEAKRSEGGTVIQAVSEAAGNFFRTRGRNLLVAAIAFLAVFSLMRLVHRYIHRLSPMRKRGRRSIAVRVVDIVYYVVTIMASTGVVLFVFYVTDDWVLLGVSLIFVAGVAWAGKHTLPLFYEQAKLMLNLGSVREDERLVYMGVPWKVETINIFTDLTNPALQGGRLRLPLRELVPMLSRPFGPKEPWFPCEEGDWVNLADETFGKVISQTPDWVQLVKLGGARKTYRTTDFIALNPENLSKGFRVSVVFGVDYQHQEISTTGIPEILASRLKAELASFVGAENVNNVAVEFREAGASSLDYEVLADFTGEAAPNCNKIRRAIPRICVDACNEHGWVIPFTQITLHQAKI